jgi:hypothetical protein
MPPFQITEQPETLLDRHPLVFHLSIPYLPLFSLPNISHTHTKGFPMLVLLDHGAQGLSNATLLRHFTTCRHSKCFCVMQRVEAVAVR